MKRAYYWVCDNCGHSWADDGDEVPGECAECGPVRQTFWFYGTKQEALAKRDEILTTIRGFHG